VKVIFMTTATVYVALGMPKRQGAETDALPMQHICAWAVADGLRTWMFDLSPYDSSRIPASGIEELIDAGLMRLRIGSAAMRLEAVNGCPDGVDDMAYGQIPEAVFDRVRSYLERKQDG